jgi:hypothetical protein
VQPQSRIQRKSAMNTCDFAVLLVGCRWARPRLIALRAALIMVLTCGTTLAKSAEKSTFVVHTDQPYGLYVVPAGRPETVEACRRSGWARLTDNNNYLEASDFVPALRPVRICFFDAADRHLLFLSPVFTARPPSERAAVVLIVRDQQVTVLQRRAPKDRNAGIWPAELGDCHFTGPDWKPRCFKGLQAAGLPARQVCSADSRFPDDPQRRLCFDIFGATDKARPPKRAELAAMVSNSRASMADRQRALEEIHNWSEKQKQLAELYRPFDSATLQVLITALNSNGSHPHPADAAHMLGLRHDPEAESALIEKFFRGDTDGVTFEAIEEELAQSGSDAAARALLAWAVSRRDVRDIVAGIVQEWFAVRGVDVVGQLERLASGPDAGVARLAHGMLERCTGQDFGADRAAWSNWASLQAPTRWAQISESEACTMPGTPEEGDPAEGSRYLQVVRATRIYSIPGAYRGRNAPPYNVSYLTQMKALEAQLYPYAFAVGHTCVLLMEGPERSMRRHLGIRPYVARGEFFSVGPGQSFESRRPWKEQASCSPVHELADDEGELVFFVGEAKYRITFHYDTFRDPAPRP